MRILSALAVLVVCIAAVSSAQDRATVQMDKASAVQAGGPIALNVKLNEPLPAGAYFQIRISPVAADQQINLNSGEPTDATRTTFRVTGNIPEAAVPGKWHISTIYLFLAGTSWTNNTIRPNDFTFDVAGKSFPIPTSADVSLAK
jgi:hypothetical protein